MLVYLAMFAMPALSTLVIGARSDTGTARPRLGLALLLTLFAVLIGLRYEVGTDWYNYQRTVDQLSYFTFIDTFGYKDPGFGIVTWLSVQVGWGLYGADMVCGAILMYGLARFVRQQPDAWLAVTAAVPYLVVVVGMGYVRQAAAIGFILVAIVHFERRSFNRFFGWMVAAMLFHGPAIVILLLAGVVLVRQRRELLIPVGLVSGLVFIILLRQRVDTFYSTYVQAEYSSSGALIRLFMNAVPAAIFLLYRKYFAVDATVRAFWTLMALFSVIFILVFPVFPSSTALDRLGLYFIPIQLFVFGRIPIVIGRTRAGARIISYLSILYYGAVLIIWLTFASNAHNWVPYKMIPMFKDPIPKSFNE